MTKNIVDLLVELEMQHFRYHSIKSNNTMHVHMSDATTRNIPALYVSHIPRKNPFKNITKKVMIEPSYYRRERTLLLPICYSVSISSEVEGTSDEEPTKLYFDLHLTPEETLEQLLRFIKS